MPRTAQHHPLEAAPATCLAPWSLSLRVDGLCPPDDAARKCDWLPELGEPPDRGHSLNQGSTGPIEHRPTQAVDDPSHDPARRARCRFGGNDRTACPSPPAVDACADTAGTVCERVMHPRNGHPKRLYCPADREEANEPCRGSFGHRDYDFCAGPSVDCRERRQARPWLFANYRGICMLHRIWQGDERGLAGCKVDAQREAAARTSSVPSDDSHAVLPSVAVQITAETTSKSELSQTGPSACARMRRRGDGELACRQASRYHDHEEPTGVPPWTARTPSGSGGFGAPFVFSSSHTRCRSERYRSTHSSTIRPDSMLALDRSNILSH